MKTLKQFFSEMKNFEQFLNEAETLTDSEKKVHKTWKDAGMEFQPGRGWKFKGSGLRSESEVWKAAARALGAKGAEKKKVYLGTEYTIGDVTIAFYKTSKGFVCFKRFIPQHDF